MFGVLGWGGQSSGMLELITLKMGAPRSSACES